MKHSAMDVFAITINSTHVTHKVNNGCVHLTRAYIIKRIYLKVRVMGGLFKITLYLNLNSTEILLFSSDLN